MYKKIIKGKWSIHEYEYQNNDKKMKVEDIIELKTPMSMLYKIKNMFRSSEKHLINDAKENNLNSNICRQQLNFSKCTENKDNTIKPGSSNKTELSMKSKIPYKVTNKSISKNDKFNTSSSLLNNSVRSKKTIPKFSGLPVLSDVSNSSNRKFLETPLKPSKFQK